MVEIGIIMGSRSDMNIMAEAADLLEKFGVSYEKRIISAHRTPNRLAIYAKHASKRGIKVIIAGAGGAAHLPGMVASHTHLPVLGVPIGLKDLGGIDSLLSIMQMPSGVPVGTLAIGEAGAKNAALLAIQILALNNKDLAYEIRKYRELQTYRVPNKAQDKVIGILGGGQLGRMLATAAYDMNKGFRCVIWDPDENACAMQVADEKIVADYNDEKALKKFIKKVDVVTLEFENIPVGIVEQIEKSRKLVAPSSKVLSVVQDRIAEKSFFDDNGISCAEWHAVDSEESAKKAGKKLRYPLILKTARFGYDGKGQVTVNSEREIIKAWRDTLQRKPCIAEKVIRFDKEVSIIGVRNQKGKIEIYDTAQNTHRNHILNWSEVPSGLPKEVSKDADKYLRIAMEKLDIIGLLALEMFVVGDKLLANEMAARPHNSGHWTMDGAETSQFEQCIRAITDMPLGSCKRTHNVIMRNLLGGEIKGGMQNYSADSEKVHVYGKVEVREGRKMGHVNILSKKLLR